MKQKVAKKMVWLPFVALAVSVGLLITVTFAWFTLSKTGGEQKVNIGSFNVNLNDDTTSYEKAKNIELTNTFPMTADYATNTANKLENTYIFQVVNTGTVNVMYRFRVTIGGDGATFAGYFNFALLHGTEAQVGEAWKLDDPAFTTPAKLDKLQEKLDDLLVDGTGSKPDGKLVGKDTAHYFKIIIWLDEKTTIENMGGTDTTKNLTVQLTLDAIQSDGGANWEDHPEHPPTTP